MRLKAWPISAGVDPPKYFDIISLFFPSACPHSLLDTLPSWSLSKLSKNSFKAALPSSLCIASTIAVQVESTIAVLASAAATNSSHVRFPSLFASMRLKAWPISAGVDPPKYFDIISLFFPSACPHSLLDTLPSWSLSKLSKNSFKAALPSSLCIASIMFAEAKSTVARFLSAAATNSSQESEPSPFASMRLKARPTSAGVLPPKYFARISFFCPTMWPHSLLDTFPLWSLSILSKSSFKAAMPSSVAKASAVAMVAASTSGSTSYPRKSRKSSSWITPQELLSIELVIAGMSSLGTPETCNNLQKRSSDIPTPPSALQTGRYFSRATFRVQPLAFVKGVNTPMIGIYGTSYLQVT